MFGKKGKTDAKELHAKNEVKRTKTQMEDFQDKISIPLHLSLPFYVVSIFLLLAGIYVIVHWAVGTFLADHTGQGFLTTFRKEFGLLDNMNDVRWKYYIPMSVFRSSLLNGIYMFLAGGVLVAMNKVGTKVYAKKKVKETMSEKR